MSRSFVVSVFLLVTVHAQMTFAQSDSTWLDWNAALQNGIRTNNQTTIYARSPSKWFGNWFNEEIGQTEPREQYLITDARTFPALDGTQLWIKVIPAPQTGTQSAVCPESCWLLLGVVQEPWQIKAASGLEALQQIDN